jgi:SAM-dependent methyltransferase
VIAASKVYFLVDLVERFDKTHLTKKLRSQYHATGPCFCPCCNSTIRKFRAFGVPPRPNAACPKCGSLERHRLVWLYLRDKTNFYSATLRVLHFAPEPVFARAFINRSNLQYVSGDLNSPLAALKLDIMHLPFNTDSFDVILCSHVLEHVHDDVAAIKELYRVLKPSGWAIVQVPIDPTLEKTFEDPTIVSPDERQAAYGYFEHVRLYGRDYKDRLERAGFSVVVDDYVRTLSADEVERYGLMGDRCTQDVFFLKKPS